MTRYKIEEKLKVNNNYHSFWSWFVINEQNIYESINIKNHIDSINYENIKQKLSEISDEIEISISRYDNKKLTLRFHNCGDLKNIVFIEELLESAPKLKYFTLKTKIPAQDNFHLNLENYIFSTDNLSFYCNSYEGYPDELNIVVAHPAMKKENKNIINAGVILFLENILEENDAYIHIDDLIVINNQFAEKELQDIKELKTTIFEHKQKLAQKYAGVKISPRNNTYKQLDGIAPNNMPLNAIINTSLFNVEAKAAYPWILQVNINYDPNLYGLPNNISKLIKIENIISERIANESVKASIISYNGVLTINYVCVSYRSISKTLQKLKLEYAQYHDINYLIYRDVYWNTINYS